MLQSIANIWLCVFCCVAFLDHMYVQIVTEEMLQGWRQGGGVLWTAVQDLPPTDPGQFTHWKLLTQDIWCCTIAVHELPLDKFNNCVMVVWQVLHEWLNLYSFLYTSSLAVWQMLLEWLNLYSFLYTSALVVWQIAALLTISLQFPLYKFTCSSTGAARMTASLQFPLYKFTCCISAGVALWLKLYILPVI